MHNLPHRVGVARFQLCKSSVHKRFMSVDSTPPKCSHLWLSSANQNFRALHLVFQGGSALFMPPCKNFHHHCTLHLPFCEFTSKMVGGFLFLQARSCFLKFFRFVAFLSHFPANFQYIKTEKPTICTAFSTVNRGFSFGALEGTRIPGPLIKRIQGASFVKFQKFEEALFLSHHRKTRLCTHRIVCIQCNTLQPLSSYSGVQKVCKNVQTGKTKPNGQINHRFYGRV